MTQKTPCQCEFANDGTFLTYLGTFKDENAFSRFMQSLETSTCFRTIDPKENFHSHLGFSENWYECRACKKIWHLVEPNSSYRGLWEAWNQESYQKFEMIQKEPCQCEFAIDKEFLKRPGEYVGTPGFNPLKPNSYLKEIDPLKPNSCVGNEPWYDIFEWYECQLCKKIWYYTKWERSSGEWNDWYKQKFEEAQPYVCRCKFWKAGKFKGSNDFFKFKKALIGNPYLKRTKFKSNSFSKRGFLETWHECLRCQSTWHFVEPTPSFAGIWEQEGKKWAYDSRCDKESNNLRRLLRLIFTILIAWLLKRLIFGSL